MRGDFNVAKGHQLTVRHNYVDAFNDIGSPSTTFFKTPDNYYRYVSATNSTVGQLNSQIGKGVNELRITYTRVRDRRDSPIGNPPFPQVNVQLAHRRAGTAPARSSSRRATPSTRTSSRSTTPSRS